MLTKIIDTDNVRFEQPELRAALDTDLIRLRRFDHREKPQGIDAFTVTVHNGIYFDSFRFFIQYGKMNGEEFQPLGKPVAICSECLPYLN